MTTEVSRVIEIAAGALPETIEAIGSILKADPAVVEKRQDGRTKRAEIRAREDIERSANAFVLKQLKRYLEKRIKYTEEGPVKEEVQFIYETTFR